MDILDVLNLVGGLLMAVPTGHHHADKPKTEQVQPVEMVEVTPRVEPPKAP